MDNRTQTFLTIAWRHSWAYEEAVAAAAKEGIAFTQEECSEYYNRMDKLYAVAAAQLSASAL